MSSVVGKLQLAGSKNSDSTNYAKKEASESFEPDSEIEEHYNSTASIEDSDKYIPCEGNFSPLDLLLFNGALSSVADFLPAGSKLIVTDHSELVVAVATGKKECPFALFSPMCSKRILRRDARTSSGRILLRRHSCPENKSTQDMNRLIDERNRQRPESHDERSQDASGRKAAAGGGDDSDSELIYSKIPDIGANESAMIRILSPITHHTAWTDEISPRPTEKEAIGTHVVFEDTSTTPVEYLSDAEDAQTATLPYHDANAQAKSEPQPSARRRPNDLPRLDMSSAGTAPRHRQDDAKDSGNVDTIEQGNSCNHCYLMWMRLKPQRDAAARRQQRSPNEGRTCTIMTGTEASLVLEESSRVANIGRNGSYSQTFDEIPNSPITPKPQKSTVTRSSMMSTIGHSISRLESSIESSLGIVVSRVGNTNTRKVGVMSSIAENPHHADDSISGRSGSGLVETTTTRPTDGRRNSTDARIDTRTDDRTGNHRYGQVHVDSR
jgi:hypothetical protein